MKKIFILLALCCYQINAQAANLLEVYQQALTSDPTFQQALATRLSTKENVPINVAALLPNIQASINPSVTKTGYSGDNYNTNASGVPLTPRNSTQYAYTLGLTATQVVFDYSKMASITGALAQSRGADATLNAALQNLIIRVASAYFAVLKDEDNLRYSEASKLAFAKQYDQVKQQYEVGLKTITDVYTAQASYDSSLADYIAAENTLDDDKENLRVITGHSYPSLATLNEAFPFITPNPANMEAWVRVAQQKNWSIKAAQYTADTARQNVQQQLAGHLPTVNIQGTVEREYTRDVNSYTTATATAIGTGTQTDRSITVNVNLPLFAGGGVIAQTNQATYDYEVTQQQLEQTIRNTINTTRQSYLGVLSGISQVTADKQAVKSSTSSLEGMKASYQVGTETLVDVLNQQQKVYQAQTEYTTDRYAYVNSILALKQAAGTLSIDDLRIINAWLSEKEHQKVSGNPVKSAKHRVKKRKVTSSMISKKISKIKT